MWARLSAIELSLGGFGGSRIQLFVSGASPEFGGALPPALTAAPLIRRGQRRIIEVFQSWTACRCSIGDWNGLDRSGRAARGLPMAAMTLFEKVWNEHVVNQEPGQPALLYIDLHLVHEVTSPQAFEGLRTHGPQGSRAASHLSPPRTTTCRPPIAACRSPIPSPARQVEALRANCTEFGVRLFDLGATEQGIVHVIGPELGLTQPGMTIVCGDSHTATHGAFGALAFGIGTSEVEHVLATQCLWQDAAAHDGNPGGRQTGAGRDRQGHHPGGDRQDRDRRRHRPRDRISRPGDRRRFRWKSG